MRPHHGWVLNVLILGTVVVTLSSAKLIYASTRVQSTSMFIKFVPSRKTKVTTRYTYDEMVLNTYDEMVLNDCYYLCKSRLRMLFQFLNEHVDGSIYSRCHCKDKASYRVCLFLRDEKGNVTC